MHTTLKLILDTRYEKKSGRYPVKLNVTFQRKPRPYQTIYDLTVEEWEKLDASRVSDSLQMIRKKLEQIETQAKDFISKMDSFSFEEFEKRDILNNSLFKQRKRKRDFTPVLQDEFDFTEYKKTFPIL